MEGTLSKTEQKKLAWRKKMSDQAATARLKKGVTPKQHKAARNAAKKERQKERSAAQSSQDPSMAYIEDPLQAPIVQTAKRYFERWLTKRALKVHLGPKEGWRTEAKLAVRAAKKGGLNIGLFTPGTHDVCDMEDCTAHHPSINEAVRLVREACKGARVKGFDEAGNAGDLRYLIFQ